MVVTDHQVILGIPETTKQLVRYQVELNSGEFQWFDERELREPVRQSSSPKLNRQWFPTSTAVVLGVVVVVLGSMLLHIHFTVNTPQKAVMAYIKLYPKTNKDVVLSSQPVEYYDGGAYLLCKSSDKSYYVYFAVQNQKVQWIARPVTAFTSKNFTAPTGHTNEHAMSNPGFFEVRNPVLETGTTAKAVIGYEHLESDSQNEIPFTFHRLWDSPYWIHYFSSYTMTSFSPYGSNNLPSIQIGKVIAYDKNGRIISR